MAAVWMDKFQKDTEKLKKVILYPVGLLITSSEKFNEMFKLWIPQVYRSQKNGYGKKKCWLVGKTHRRKTEMRPQRSDNVFCEVRLVRVPDEAYGNYLWGVHEDPSDPNPLATVALAKKDTEKD